MVDHTQMERLSVLMAVHNEARTLRTIVGKVLSAPIPIELELICVDDGSTDRSWEILSGLAQKEPRIVPIRHPNNRGKSAALRTAIAAMTGTVAIVQDADLEYDPADIPRVIKPILDGRADAVYGSRFAHGTERRVLFFWHSVGNQFITLISNALHDLNLTDIETGYKAVRADVLRQLRLTSDRFGFEPEVTARLAQWGARIYEVPVSYHGRSYDEGKQIGWRDGIHALWLILKLRFIDTRFVADPEHVTRQSLGKARRFRRWLLDQFGDALGQRVLEVNPGPGHVTSLLLDRERLVALESVRYYSETLRRRFGHLENVRIEYGDPVNPIDMERLADERVDTVLCLESLQRAIEPKDLLAAIADPLIVGGRVLVHVPADQQLFGDTDRAIGHVRRFSEPELRATLEAAGLDVEWVRPFNRLGRIAWRLHDALGLDGVSGFESRLFGVALPAAKRIEKLGRIRGLSLLAVGRKR
jgi:glycosyltransferase involved in cell wall biosynthesis